MNVANSMRSSGKQSLTSGAIMGVMLAITAIFSTGCTSILSPIRGIPVRMLPPQFLWRPRTDMIDLELYRLTRKQPKEYELDAGDLLAFYIEGVTGEPDAIVPTHFPEKGSDLSPVTGYPFPIRDDGTISLPLIPAINAKGMTLTKLEERVRDEYTVKRKILQPGRDRITIGLIKERTTRVVVIRQDQMIANNSMNQQGGNQQRVVQGSDESGKGFVLDLKAYKNDLMNALAESGGLPGLRAKNEVKILRRAKADPEKREQFVRDFFAQHALDPCLCPPPLPEDPSTTVVPLRYYPEEMPDIREEDIILEEGDIVYIESREAELFYTGGMLNGGQWPLPRDYDLDALGAMGVAGFGIERAKAYIEEHVRYTYACPNCRSGSQLLTTSKPPAPLEKSPFGASVLAWIISAKFERHLPTYRHQEMLLPPLGIWLSRPLLANLLQDSARVLRPLAESGLRELLYSSVIQADETPVKYLGKEPGKSSTGYLFGYAGDAEHRFLYYDYRASRSRAGPAEILADYRGVLLTDGLSGYEALVQESQGRLTAPACWMHARREFDEARATTSHPLVEETLARIRLLYDLEDRAKAFTPEERCGSEKHVRWWTESSRDWSKSKPRSAPRRSWPKPCSMPGTAAPSYHDS